MFILKNMISSNFLCIFGGFVFYWNPSIFVTKKPMQIFGTLRQTLHGFQVQWEERMKKEEEQAGAELCQAQVWLATQLTNIKTDSQVEFVC